MSIASDILRLSANSLLWTHGEQVEFRSENVLCIIDRTVPPEAVQRAELDLIQSEASEVWMRISDVQYPPRIGESFEDAVGLWHVIRATRKDGIWYKLLCEVNERQ